MIATARQGGDFDSKTFSQAFTFYAWVLAAIVSGFVALIRNIRKRQS